MKEEQPELIKKRRPCSWNYRPPSKTKLLLRRLANFSAQHREHVPLILSGFLFLIIASSAAVVILSPNTEVQDSARTALNNKEQFTRETQTKINQGELADLTIDKFLTANSLQKRLNYINNLHPTLQPQGFGPPALQEPQLSYRKIGHPILMKKNSTPIYLQEIEVQSHRLPLLLIQNDDQWLVDYEAFTGHNQTSWHDLASPKALEVTVRVTIERSWTHGPGFENTREWLPYQLNNPNWPLPLEGFVERGSDTARHLAHIREGASVFKDRVILLIKREPNHRERQFKIIELREKGWSSTST